MATRKKPAPVAEVVEQDTQDFYTFDAMQSRIESIKADMGIEGELDASAFVYKVEPGAKNNPVVWSGLPEHYDLASIAQDHGSGDYRYILWARDSDGLKARRMDVTLAYRLTPAQEAKRNAALLAAANPTLPEPGGNGSGLGEIKEMFRGMMEANAQMLRSMVEQQRPKADPLDEMAKLAGVMKTLMPAPIATAPGGDIMSFLTMMKTFNDITGNNKTQIPEGADTGTAILMKAMDTLGPAFAESIKQKQAQPQVVPAIAAPQPASTMTPEQEEDFMLFKLQLRAACKLATSGSDPAAFAETVYGMLSDDAINSLAFEPGWFAYLTQTEPNCAPHEAWFSKVREAIIEFGVEDGNFVRDAAGLRLAGESDTIPANPDESIPNGVTDGEPVKP